MSAHLSTFIGLLAVAVSIAGHTLAVVIGSVIERRTMREISAAHINNRKAATDGRQDPS